jgi:protein disulfide-isomerase
VPISAAGASGFVQFVDAREAAFAGHGFVSDKFNMKALLLYGLMAVASAAGAEELTWLTDVNKAQEAARDENKYILLDFTGSDWSATSAKLKKEVFDQPEFATYAKTNLVMVQLDFPHQTPQDPALKAANEALAKELNVQNFPTIVLVDANGRAIGFGGFMEGGPRVTIAELERIIRRSKGLPEPEPETPARPPDYSAIPPTAPVTYGLLRLQSISGAADHRLAMINGELFNVGDSGKVKVRDTRFELRCDAIRDNSVLITVDGKQMELKLGNH